MSESNEKPRRLWDREIEAKEISIFTPLERFNQSTASREAYGFTNQELQAVVPQLEAMKSVAADFLWRLQVKRTPLSPEYGEWVMLWWRGTWEQARYLGNEGWWIDRGLFEPIQDGQYWMPWPNFNPEGQS